MKFVGIVKLWGDSLTIRLPKKLAINEGIVVGKLVEITTSRLEFPDTVKNWNKSLVVVIPKKMATNVGIKDKDFVDVTVTKKEQE